MKFRISIYLAVVSLLISCNNNTAKNKDPLLTSTESIADGEYISNNVVITGTSDDPNAFKYLNIMNISYFLGRHHLDTYEKIFPDSLFVVLKSFEKPLIMEIVTGEDYLYKGTIFAIPGDTIQIKVKDGAIKFYGKNAVYNNYYTQMNNNTRAYMYNPYKGNLNIYKKSVDSIYNERVDFLNNYIKKYNIQSKYFINAIATDLRHEYLFTLLNPKTKKSSFLGYYYSEIDMFKSLVQKEAYNHPERIIDVSNYFGTVTIDEFNNLVHLNNSMFFKENINQFIRYYFLDSKLLAYSKEMFIAEKEFIQNNFEGGMETYCIARMIRDYHRKGFSNSLENINVLRGVIDEYEEKFTKPVYMEYMNEAREDLDSFNFNLSEPALDTKFVNHIGDTLTLRKIFARSSKRIKVIDFWASWCPPCVDQIKNGKPFKDRLQVENNVEWIYLSVDKNYEQWLKANNEFEDVLNFSNSFFILNGYKSALASSLKVKGIPRYVILNQKNKIVSNTAPPTSDTDHFERIIDEVDIKN